MAKIYGKVESGPNATFNPVETTLKQCIDFGFTDPNCFMVTWIDGGCLFYNYSPITKPMIVVETEEDSGSYVAIKLALMPSALAHRYVGRALLVLTVEDPQTVGCARLVLAMEDPRTVGCTYSMLVIEDTHNTGCILLVLAIENPRIVGCMLLVLNAEDPHTTFNANTCPATFNDIDLTFTAHNGDTYPWTKTADGVSFSGCRSGWTRFDRANGRSVCLQAFKLSFGVTKPAAISACQQASADIVGVENKEELTWMFEQKNSLVGRDNSFWVDGERVPECLPPIELKKVAGCNDFTWSNDLTSNIADLSDKSLADMSYYDPYDRVENCLALFSFHGVLNDVSCTQFDSAEGVICGYQLL
ncbi:unnamed protein product [Caenorhabditis brenneri]